MREVAAPQPHQASDEGQPHRCRHPESLHDARSPAPPVSRPRCTLPTRGCPRTDAAHRLQWWLLEAASLGEALWLCAMGGAWGAGFEAWDEGWRGRDCSPTARRLLLRASGCQALTWPTLLIPIASKQVRRAAHTQIWLGGSYFFSLLRS